MSEEQQLFKDDFQEGHQEDRAQLEEKKEEPEKVEGPVVTSNPPQEVHHHYHQDQKKGIGVGRIILAIVIIFIGIVYLGRAAGWITVDVNLWQLWPLIIIIIGLGMLSRSGWMVILIGILVALVVLGLLIWMIVVSPADDRAVTTETISIEKEEDVDSAVFDLNTGAGSITMSGGAEKLINGTHDSNFLTYEQETKVEDGIQTVAFDGKGSWRGFRGDGVNDLDLTFNNDTPLKVVIDSGAVDIDLDFSAVMLTDLDVNTGASSVDLTMGDLVEMSSVSIDAGVSSVKVTLPKTIGAKVNLESGLTSRDLENFTEVDSNNFQSENYDESEKKVNFDIDLGVSSLKFEWQD